MQRYFTDQKLKTGDVVQLDATIAKHAIKVLRQDIGDRFELVDPMHHAYLAIIQQSSPLQVAIDEDITKKVELPLAVEVVCGVSKGDKSEWVFSMPSGERHGGRRNGLLKKSPVYRKLLKMLPNKVIETRFQM